MATEPLHNPEETAAILGISVKTLREHVDMGRIRSSLLGTGKARKHRRFSDKNIASFIENQKVREVPVCPSTDPKILHFITPVSKSAHKGFTALQSPKTKKRLNSLNGGGASKP